MSKDIARDTAAAGKPIVLADGATVVVVGGGPAGAFFAIRAARKARQRGMKLDLVILERKKELHFYEAVSSVAFREGCNYCAGSVSPLLTDLLEANGLPLPEEIVEGKARSLTVHADWKSIELPIPEGRDIVSVFRGSRPRRRSQRHVNFDAYLLEQAVKEGARVITGEVQGIRYNAAGKPVVSYRIGSDAESKTIEADLAVFGGGVNQTPGMALRANSLFRSLGEVLPGFRPPEVRKAIICEVLAQEELLQSLAGEVHFAQYGSKDLRIEMSLLVPRGHWITVVLIGPSVDRADPAGHLAVVERFLELPHIRRFLPRKAKLTPACMCNPNMTVGVARNPIGDRIALIGDMVVSRLYKDGIYSALTTAAALAECALDVGVDRKSLKRGYKPAVRRFERENRFGRIVFLLNRLTFSQPVLSRIAYQAVLTERKTKPKQKRRLANVLWRIASGDDTYGRILASMFHPATVRLILVGGVAVTIRNYVAELVFGLNWTGFGRHPTGVPKEDVAKKRREIVGVLGIRPFEHRPDFERVYSIRIKADRKDILHQLGKFGDLDRQYLRPRMIDIYRTRGDANEAGSTIRYDVLCRRLSFSVVLEKVLGSRYLLYRIANGFAQGGVLAFDVDCEETGVCLLSIYVAFDFPRRRNPLNRVFWRLFRWIFPAFVHDVAWNHSLCRIKHLAESDQR